METPAAKTNERTGRGMNRQVDKSIGEGESDEGSSKDRDGVSGSDGASKMKRRRGELCCNCYYDCVCFGLLYGMEVH